MAVAFDSHWEYWEPDLEIAEVMYPSRLNDRTIAGYLGHVEGGFRFGSGAAALASLTNRTRVLATDVVLPKVCAVCGHGFQTKRVDQAACGRRCHNTLASESRWGAGRDALVEKALELKREGRSLPQIAAAVGVSGDTVSRWLGEAGLGGEKPQPLPVAVRRRAMELARAGHYPTKIAAEVGASVPTVKRWIKTMKRETTDEPDDDGRHLAVAADQRERAAMLADPD
jgi:transposase